MSTEVLALEVMAIICCHQREGKFFSNLDYFLIDLLLVIHIVILKFQKEVALPHDVPVLICDLNCARNIFLVDVVG